MTHPDNEDLVQLLITDHRETYSGAVVSALRPGVSSATTVPCGDWCSVSSND